MIILHICRTNVYSCAHMYIEALVYDVTVFQIAEIVEFQIFKIKLFYYIKYLKYQLLQWLNIWSNRLWLWYALIYPVMWKARYEREDCICSESYTGMGRNIGVYDRWVCTHAHPGITACIALKTGKVCRAELQHRLQDMSAGRRCYMYDYDIQ